MKLVKIFLVLATMIFSIMVHAETESECKAKNKDGASEVFALVGGVCKVDSCLNSKVLRDGKCVDDVCTRDLSDNRSGGAKLDANGKPIPVGGSDHQ